MEKNYQAWASYLAPVIMGNSDRPELSRELEESFCTTDAIIARQFAETTFYSDNRGDLSKRTVPSLILQCSDDLIAPLEVGAYIHLNVPKSTLQFMEVMEKIPGVDQLLTIKGIGRDTVAGFLAEVGDISNYHHPKQIIKLAGLNLRENTSGKHKGQAKITKRGRKKLRALLFRVIMPLVAKNQAFKTLHEYYTKRPDNPLKKIALCNKLIRILFGIMKKGHEFSEAKMLQDIPRYADLLTAA